MQITTVGIDLAKNVFQIHGVNEHGKAVLRKQLRRDQVAPFFANLQACLIGMEACASAHHWARKLVSLGHTVRLMAPQFVKPYVKSNKNDAADAEAICEAVSRPSMRFVPIKNVEQQAVLALHRVRQGFVKARTAQANQIRGLLGEYGLIVPQGIAYVTGRVPKLIEDASIELPGSFRLLIDRLLEHLRLLHRQVDEIEAQIKAWHRSNEASRRLELRNRRPRAQRLLDQRPLPGGIESATRDRYLGLRFRHCSFRIQDQASARTSGRLSGPATPTMLSPPRPVYTVLTGRIRSGGQRSATTCSGRIESSSGCRRWRRERGEPR